MLIASCISRLDGGALEWATRGLQSARDASPRDKSVRCGQTIVADGAFVPKLMQGLLTRGALDKAAGAILGNWKNGIGATAGLPSSSKSMRSDDAAVCSHGGPSSASSRDSELRFRWGDDVLLLDDVLSLPVSLAADIEEEEDWAVIFGTGHPSCGNCIGVNSSALVGRQADHELLGFVRPCLPAAGCTGWTGC